MRVIEISSFLLEKNERFNDVLAFIFNNKALIVEKNGHILILDMYDILKLIEHKVPIEIKEVLKNRGFIIKNEDVKCYTDILVRPEFFMIDLTNKCNMRCQYCLRNVTSNYSETISKETLKDICKYIEKYCAVEKLSHISVQAWGGEPLLEKDKILALRNWIKPEKTKVHISIETNGILLNSFVAKELFDNKIGIGISIDGMQRVHDRQRYLISQVGSYKYVEKNLISSQNLYGKRLGTITTITKKNADEVENIIEHFAVNLNLTNIKINFVHNSKFSICDNLCMNEIEIAETEKRIVKKIVELQERGYKIVEYNIKVKLKNILFREYSDICLSCGCCGGRKMIVFDMKGNIYPCELTDNPEYKIGNIYDKRDLKQVVSDAIKTNNIFFEKKESKECKTCYWKYFCRGGCTVRLLSNGELPPHVDKIECAINQVLYPELIKLILNKPQIVNKIMEEDVLEDDETYKKRIFK